MMKSSPSSQLDLRAALLRGGGGVFGASVTGEIILNQQTPLALAAVGH